MPRITSHLQLLQNPLPRKMNRILPVLLSNLFRCQSLPPGFLRCRFFLLLLDFAIRDRWLIDWRREAIRARELFERYAIRLDPLAPLSRLTPVERAQLAIVRAFDQLRARGAGSAHGLLVLDEPYNALDADGAELLDATLAEPRAFVVATHAPDRVERRATQLLALA